MDDAITCLNDKKIILVEGISGVGKSTYIKNNLFETKDGTNALVIHGDRFRPNCRNTIEQYSQDNKKQLYNTLLAVNEETIVIDGLIHTTEYDLLGFFEVSMKEIEKYYENLLFEMRSSCRLIYIYTQEIDSLIDVTLGERENQRKDWIEGFNEFLNHAPLALHNGWKGKNGAKSFLNYVHSVNEYIFANINVEKYRYIR